MVVDFMKSFCIARYQRLFISYNIYILEKQYILKVTKLLHNGKIKKIFTRDIILIIQIYILEE